MKKEIRQLIRQLNQQGFDVRTTRRGHYLVSRNGRVVAGIPGTPSDWRSMKNTRSELRRAGFVSTKFA